MPERASRSTVDRYLRMNSGIGRGLGFESPLVHHYSNICLYLPHGFNAVIMIPDRIQIRVKIIFL